MIEVIRVRDTEVCPECEGLGGRLSREVSKGVYTIGNLWCRVCDGKGEVPA